MSKTEQNQELAAARAGMDPKTARKYLRQEKLPSESKAERAWRTRTDPFAAVWDEVREQVAASPGFRPSHVQRGRSAPATVT